MGCGALLRPLRGQLGAALFFDGVLPAAQVEALFELGPDYQSPLLPTESSGLLDQHPGAATALALSATATAAAVAAAAAAGSSDSDAAAAAAALVGSAGPQGQPPKLLLAFCPRLAAAEVAAVSGSKVGSRGMREAALGLPAALLPGMQLCRTRQPHDCLHCLGGVAVLLPLLEHAVPAPLPDGGASCRPLATSVLRLLAAMLRGSPSNQQASAQVGAFALAGHLLEQQAQCSTAGAAQQGGGARSSRHLSGELLAAQQQLLGAVAECGELAEAVLRHLILNLRLWSAAPPGVQHQVLSLWGQLAEVSSRMVGTHVSSAPWPQGKDAVHNNCLPCPACLFSHAQGEPLLVRRLLPPAHLLHHVRGCYFSGGLRSARSQPRAASFAGGLGETAEQQQPGHGLAPVASAPALLQQGEEAAQGTAAAAELRRAYLRLAAAIIAHTAAAGSRSGGAAAAAGSRPAAADDQGLAGDLRAVLSLVADCCAVALAAGSGAGGSEDAALLQELLTLVLLPLLSRRSLARLPLLACLQQLGGPTLLLPLLQLEQQQLRLLGLRALTASLAGNASRASSGSASSEVSRRRSLSPSRAASLQRPPPPPQEACQDVVEAAGHALAAFPLNPATRIALVELLCDGAPWAQVRGLPRMAAWQDAGCRLGGHTMGHIAHSDQCPFRWLPLHLVRPPASPDRRTGSARPACFGGG